jgi:hypothetical protein
MPKPTGPQFVTLYRGLSNVSPDEVKTTDVGPHWSRSHEVAYNFATDRDVEGWPHDDGIVGDMDDVNSRYGTVIEAKVHRRHIIDPESQEGQDWQGFAAVQHSGSQEQESTVRPGAPVHVLRMHLYDEDNANNEKTIVNDPFRRRFKA